MALTHAPSLEPQPLRWWSPEDLRCLEAVLAAAWGDWLQRWSPTARRQEPLAQAWLAWAPDASPWAADHWVPLGGQESRAAWLKAGEEDWAACVLFGVEALVWQAEREPRPGRLARALAARAAADWRAALRELLGLGPAAACAEPGGGLWRPWSGAVAVQLGSGGVSCDRILLNQAAARRARERSSPKVRPVPRQRAPLACGEGAAAGLAVRASAGLQSFEMQLGALVSLQVGDVIALPHRIEEPLLLSVRDGALARCLLGARQGRRAVELLGPAPAGPASSP